MLNIVDHSNIENDLENDLKLIVKNHKNGSNASLDLINLLDKYDENNRWKIMAQICSHFILFKDSENRLLCVKQFTELISDRNVACSEIVTVRKGFKLFLFCFIILKIFD